MSKIQIILDPVWFHVFSCLFMSFHVSSWMFLVFSQSPCAGRMPYAVGVPFVEYARTPRLHLTVYCVRTVYTLRRSAFNKITLQGRIARVHCGSFANVLLSWWAHCCADKPCNLDQVLQCWHWWKGVSRSTLKKLTNQASSISSGFFVGFTFGRFGGAEEGFQHLQECTYGLIPRRVS